jgi:hypothetical protein
MDQTKLKTSITEEDQRNFIKFGVLLKKDAKTIHDELVTALGRQAYPARTVRYWVQQIKDGRIDVSDQRGGAHNFHPERDERIARIKEQLDVSRAWSLSVLALKVNVPKTTLWELLTQEFGLSKKYGKLVPHLLSEDQREARVNVCYSNLVRYRRRRKLLDRTLAIDETWVLLYQPPNKDQQRFWLEKGAEAPRIVAQELRTKKAMLIFALDFEGVAFWHLCEEGQTVNSELYREVLAAKVPDWMERKGITKPILLHDNARPHKSAIVREFLVEIGMDT